MAIYGTKRTHEHLSFCCDVLLNLDPMNNVNLIYASIIVVPAIL
jgi:hypothetical protein